MRPDGDWSKRREASWITNTGDVMESDLTETQIEAMADAAFMADATGIGQRVQHGRAASPRLSAALLALKQANDFGGTGKPAADIRGMAECYPQSRTLRGVCYSTPLYILRESCYTMLTSSIRRRTMNLTEDNYWNSRGRYQAKAEQACRIDPINGRG